VSPVSGSVADQAHRLSAHSVGWLESPHDLRRGADCAVVSGWAFSRLAPIKRIFARCGTEEHQLQYGIARPDVAAAYPSDIAASTSGFSGFVEFERGPSIWNPLEVWATLADHRSERLFCVRPSVVTTGKNLILRALRRHVEGESNQSEHGRALTPRSAFLATRSQELQIFLAGNNRLSLAPQAEPVVTAVVVVWNQPELVLGCLRSLRQSSLPLQVVIVDNASSDLTVQLLSRIDGAQIIRNDRNTGFVGGANQGARLAATKFILFVNSDAELLPDCAERLKVLLDTDATVGAAGAKLVWPDGVLQEAGSTIWSDGGCQGYGRGEDPEDPAFGFRRDVDFCSAATLMTPTDLFEELGGFAESYSPAYYEDADYCARIWESGRRVCYQPAAVAVHVEFASTGDRRVAERMQLERRRIFVDRNRSFLLKQPLPSTPMLKARHHPWNKPSILVIDDILPDPVLGAGFPRAAALLETLRELGYGVTLFATSASLPSDAVRQRFGWVESFCGQGPEQLSEFLASRKDSFAGVLVSRPHNCRYLKAAAGKSLASLGIPVIYDAEAIFASREVGRDRLMGRDITPEQEQVLVREEVRLAAGCSGVFTVSDADRNLFLNQGLPNVSVVSHSVSRSGPLGAPSTGNSILFVGVFDVGGPNEDAAEFLVQSIGPAIRDRLSPLRPIVIAGRRLEGLQSRFERQQIQFICNPASLEKLYLDARVFVAPTRFAAGIPLKIIEAASYGIPVVCSPLLASQLGWTPGQDLLTAVTPADYAHEIARLYEDPALWLRVRDSAIQRIDADYRPRMFVESVKTALQSGGISTVEPATQTETGAPRRTVLQ